MVYKFFVMKRMIGYSFNLKPKTFLKQVKFKKHKALKLYAKLGAVRKDGCAIFKMY
jgi:hypothetical protein